jgi:uncharacterized damage-inducible protein DinB
MNWIAPEFSRVDEPSTGDERAMLNGFLDWYRGTLLVKCQGLTPEQLAEQAVPPSNLSLIGLVRHMTEVEQGWFRRGFSGEDVPRPYTTEPSSDEDIEEASAATAAADYELFVRELDLCRAAVAGRGLDETFMSRHNREMSLRWIYIHMIEEYARHCGHADLLRERIDGATGD